MIRQDSIQQYDITVEGDAAVAVHRPLTPAQVLSWLSPNATPAQQDSAIQAHFKPGEIRWSQRPDTLHLPGHDKGHNLLDVDLPQYYREGFFSKDTLFHPELPGGRFGVAGDPVPYTVHGDNVLTSLLLFCFMLTVVAFTGVKDFFLRQTKNLLYTYREESSEFTETASEVRFQVYMVMLAAFLISLLYYFYTLHYIGDTFILKSQYYLIGVYMAIVVAYFLLKAVLYLLVNNVFFDGKRMRQWNRSLLFVTSVESILLFPAVMLQSYTSISIESVELYFTLALITVKILTIYQCYNIFFRRNVVKVQIILYFCALELIPLLMLWGILDITAKFLKINY